MEATANTVQEGIWATADAVMEKKTKARGPGHPRGMGKAIQSSGGACKVDGWVRGLDEGASNGEVRTGNSHVPCGQGRQHQQQRAPRIPRGSLGGSPSF